MKLKLRGYIGIKKGIGQDEIELDLSNLTGLIAFDGPNGKGKTTILENLHPFRRLASRKGSLAHHVFLRDSEKDFTFSFAGHVYRTLIKIDAQSTKQEGFIWKDGIPQVDGKVKEYDKYIIDLLGTPDLFFQSIFSAQNAETLNDLDPAPLKTLFAEFLRLNKMMAWEETAKQAGNLIADQIEILQRGIGDKSNWKGYLRELMERESSFIVTMENLDSGISAREKSIEDLKAEIQKAETIVLQHNEAMIQKQKMDSERESLENDFTELIKSKAAISQILEVKTALLPTLEQNEKAVEKALSDLQVIAAEQASAIKQKADLEKRISEKREQVTGLQKKKIDLVTAWKEEKNRILDELEPLEKSMAGSGVKESIEKSIEDLDQIIQEAEERTSKTETDIDDFEDDISRMSGLLKEVNDQDESETGELSDGLTESEIILSKLRSGLSEAQRVLEKLNSDNTVAFLKQEITSLQHTADKLEQRDPECKSETCVFIKDALDARAELPEVKKRLSDFQHDSANKVMEQSAKIENAKIEVSDQEEKHGILQEKAVSLTKSFRAKREKLESDIQGVQVQSKTARADLVEQRKKLKFSRDQRSGLEKDLEAFKNIEVVKVKIDNLEGQLSEKEGAFNVGLDELSRGLMTAENDEADLILEKGELRIQPDVDQKISEKRGDLETTKKTISDIRETISDLEIKQAVAQQKIDSCTTTLAALEKAISGLPIDHESAGKQTSLKNKLDDAEQHLESMKEKRSGFQSDIALLKHRITETAETGEKVRKAEQRITDLQGELSEWRYIQDACGKDGLRALEIEGTAPLIAGHANDLLNQTFGTNDTVGFRTLNDDGKECLDIVVYRDSDPDENGTLLDNLSGGEGVWILKSLRLALTLVSKEKSGKDFNVALSDEEDGALDDKNAISFIMLYRAFMKAGGFDACLYITHREPCKAMADHIIRLSDSGIVIDSISE